ncbi:hypothetical protein Hsar01_02911 [Haloferula sargassicola]|uniref:Uncharacterized protein n=1 Tax=Haloferula sargassicola TaxID=490096 RepID=A0ABP9USJ2_9BACT
MRVAGVMGFARGVGLGKRGPWAGRARALVPTCNAARRPSSNLDRDVTSQVPRLFARSTKNHARGTGHPRASHSRTENHEPWTRAIGRTSEGARPYPYPCKGCSNFDSFDRFVVPFSCGVRGAGPVGCRFHLRRAGGCLGWCRVERWSGVRGSAATGTPLLSRQRTLDNGPRSFSRSTRIEAAASIIFRLSLPPWPLPPGLPARRRL